MPLPDNICPEIVVHYKWTKRLEPLVWTWNVHDYLHCKQILSKCAKIASNRDRMQKNSKTNKDREVASFQLLSTSIKIVPFSLNQDNSSGIFSCKSYFWFLTNSSTRERFLLGKLIWNTKAHSKISSFLWTATLKSVKINMLQVCFTFFNKPEHPDILELPLF